MSFLGLVGVPATKFTYDTYRALKALSPALGAAFAGAEAAAIASIAAQGAAVLGAGALGWMIGSAIRKQLGLDDEPQDLSSWVSGGTPGQQVIVSFIFKSEPNAPIPGQVVVTAPFAGILRKSTAGTDDVFYLRQVNPPEDVNMVSFGPGLNPRARIEITNMTTIAGQPIPNLKQVPVYPQKPVYVPVRVPVIIPATPSSPEFPVTPEVVPTPGNEPDEDNKKREPGITVKIPELGLQIQYTPTGVTMGRYSDPGTKPYEPPRIALPPGQIPPAQDPCECEEGENKDDEIICRIKTLQKELLDDGYETETHLAGASSYINVDGLPDEFYRLEISVTQVPKNVQKQHYSVDDATVTWVGWLSWNFGLRKSERISLQFMETGFRPPPECTGYTIAMNDGCLCSALALTRSKKDYIDEC